MHKNKSANRNPANYRLYHALMEALIEDENAMDKEVADTKRRKRESESAKKPSTTKESSKGKDPKVGSKTGKSAPAKDPVEEPTDKVIMDEQPTEDIPISDEGHVLDLEDTDNAHMPKIPDTTTCTSRSDENKLHNKIDDIGSFIRWYCRRIGKEELSKANLEGPTSMMVKGFHENNISLQFHVEECHKLLTNQIDLVNREGHRIVLDISNPLPLGGPPGQLKAALYQDFRLEELVPSLWIEGEQVYDISEAYGITHWWFSRKQFYINKHIEPSDRDAVRSHMRILSVISMKDSESTLPILLSFTHCGNKSILRFICIILVILPEHPSEMKVFHNEDGNPARANIKQALGR
ncbi:hypothetical protein Tco_0006749 [Tanacetum coccineum]